MSDTKRKVTQADNHLLASFKHHTISSQILRVEKTGMCIVVLCTTLISRIYTGDKAKIEAASSNKEAKRVEERVAEEVTITTGKETRINVFFTYFETYLKCAFYTFMGVD